MVMADLSRALSIHCPHGLDGGLFLWLGQQVLRRGTDPQGPQHRRDRLDVLLVEDIIDTGLTLSYLVNNLRSRGPRQRAC